MIRRLLPLIFFALMLSPVSVLAQAHDGLGGYTPPPLFQDPKYPDPKKNPPKRDLRLPTLSQQPDDFAADADITEEGNLIEPRLIPAVPDLDAPVKESPPEPPSAPTKPEIVKKPDLPPAPVKKPEVQIERQAVKKIEPISPKIEEPSPPAAAVAPPAAPPIVAPPVKISKPPPVTNNEGVVKGPKTMPSNKKSTVEALPTFEPEQKPEEVDILKRVQEEKAAAEKAEQQAQDAKIETSAPLPALETMADGNRRAVILFVPGKADLSPAHQKTLDALIAPELEKNTGLSLLIESYASPQTGVLSADRRISLSRALAVRQYLLDKKLAPGRIDVRAMGAQTNIQPLDRVELILIP